LVVKTVQPKNKNTKVQGRVILKQKIVL
jgi:hypothetical protein